jgi:hypothetical protein
MGKVCSKCKTCPKCGEELNLPESPCKLYEDNGFAAVTMIIFFSVVGLVIIEIVKMVTHR